MPVVRTLPGPWGAVSVKRPVVYDNFNRMDDATTLGSARTGQPWVVPVGAVNKWGISRSYGYQAVDDTATSKQVMAVINSGLVVVDVSLTIAEAQTGNSIGCGIAFRHSGTSNTNFWAFYTNRNGSGNISWFLDKNVAGVNTNLFTASYTALTGVLRVIDTGTLVNCYIDGVFKASSTDTALNTNTYQGMQMAYTSLGGANSGTGWRLNDYSVSR